MTNPYDYRQPLSGSARFFARDSTLTQVASRVAADHPQSLALVGPRRTGKTSLINGLCDGRCWEGLVDQDQLTIAMFSLAQDIPRNDVEFLSLIESRLGGAASGVSNPNDRYEQVTDLVRQAASGGRKLILVFDDFEIVTQNREISLALFAFLRSLANNYDVALLTTSCDVPWKACHTEALSGAPFFNIFTTLNFEPFSETAARELVEEPTRTVGKPFGQDLVDCIVGLAGGSPYLLQLTAAVAFDLRQGGADKGSIAGHALSEAWEYLEDLWTTFSRPEKRVLLKILDGKPPPGRLRYAVERLERSGMLSLTEGEYGFHGLFALYLDQSVGKSFMRRLFT